MNILKVLLIIHLCLSIPVYSQFVIQNINRPLNSVNFSNNKNGYIFDGSIIYTSNNAGANWSLPKICTPLLSNYTSGKFFFVDSLYGWSSKGSSTIIRTTNGGNSWIEYLVAYVYITDLFFVNRYTGWAIANENNSPYITVYKTTNSGLNWFSQNIIGYEKKPMLSMFFKNENIGCIGMDSGKIAQTTNGGNSWNVLFLNSAKKVSLINFKTENCGWIWLNPGQIIRTTNAGLNWSLFLMPFANENAISSFFTDSLKGWVTTSGNHLVYTNNGGQNWSSINTGSIGSISNIIFNNQFTGWLVTSANQIIKTTNSGLNWITINNTSNANFNSVYFHNINTGWIVTDNGAIYKTINSGINWNINFDYGACVMSKIFFQNKLTGWVSGSGGYFFKTTNSGINWNIINITNLPSNAMCFIDLNTGWLTGNNGKIAKSLNGGNNWSIIQSPTLKSIKDIDFINNSHGIFCGDTGAVFMSSNAGLNWNQIYVADTVNFTAVKYLSSSEIFLAGYHRSRRVNYPGPDIYITNRKLFKSSNNGVSWNSIVNHTIENNNGVYYPFNSISLDKGSGSVCLTGKDSYIIVSFDRGVTWSSNASPNLNVLSYNGLFMFDAQHLWAVGDYASVVSSFTPIIGISQNTFELPNNFNLSQNYPNPFNPKTNIKFDIAKSGFVKITIFDLLGREITTLVNEQMQPGSYNVDWDASNYPSGVYFYKIIVGDNTNNGGYTESRKMVLVK